MYLATLSSLDLLVPPIAGCNAQLPGSFPCILQVRSLRMQTGSLFQLSFAGVLWELRQSEAADAPHLAPTGAAAPAALR